MSILRSKLTPFDGGNYNFAAGLGAAIVSINPANALTHALLTVAATCSAPGASITIQVAGAPAFPAIPVPPGGSVTVDIDGGIATSHDIDVTFVGTDTYFTDWIEDIP